MLVKNKHTTKLKAIVIVLIILLLILSVLGIKFLIDSFKPDIYKVDSRIKNIKEEQKKDNSLYVKTIGWVKVQGTKIDTPIIYYYGDDEGSKTDENADADHYIKKENYVWNMNSKEKLFNKVSIMGHNLLNLSTHPDVSLKHFSRFDDLMAFVYYDHVKDNKYIQYTIDGKNYIYKIYSVEFVNYYKLDLYSDSNYTKKEKDKFINDTKKNSIYDFDVSVNNKDKFISLITCTRFFGDNDKINFRVNARLVRKGEKLKNYGVKVNKKYSKVKKILEGEENEEV